MTPIPVRRALVVAVAVAVALATVACSTLGPSPNGQSAPGPSSVAASGPATTASPQPTAPVVTTATDLFGGTRLFGVTIGDRSAAAVAKVTETVGCRPTLLQLYASVDTGISAETLRGVAGTPVLSIEPWRTGAGPRQPEWSLATTIDGRWDAKYTALAAALVEYRKPVLIRFAHEMNGDWYPWGVANGNKPGQFVAAWKHVVDLFRAAGATNALWVWSPNILRGASSRTVKEFWPGKTYVDIVGLTGYGSGETNPAATYRTTLNLVYALTDQPILLTEVGVKAGTEKRMWLAAFGPWLRDNPRIAGFLWNEVTRDGDWRYDDTPAHLTAFKSGLSAADLRC